MREHLFSDKNSNIFKHLKDSDFCKEAQGYHGGGSVPFGKVMRAGKPNHPSNERLPV